jgi:hypothetical protein
LVCSWANRTELVSMQSNMTIESRKKILLLIGSPEKKMASDQI